jgi:hypothetical protein
MAEYAAFLVATYYRPEQRFERELAEVLTRDVREVERWIIVGVPPPGYQAPTIGPRAIPVLLEWLAEEELRPPQSYRLAIKIPMPALQSAALEYLEMNHSVDIIEKVKPSLQSCAYRVSNC